MWKYEKFSKGQQSWLRREMNCNMTLKSENLVLTTSKKRHRLSQREDLLVSARCAQVKEYGSQQPFPAIL